MKKFFKTISLLGGSAIAAHFGFKVYRRIHGLVKLSNSLPEFLSNVYGETPQMDIHKYLRLISIEVGFSQEILDKHDDIENTIREYIDDFYPELAKCSIDIELGVKGEEAYEAEPPEEFVDKVEGKEEDVKDKEKKHLDK